MHSIIRWFLNNHIAANLLMVIILAAGVLSLPQIRKEFLPEHSLNTITISVLYPGAAPEDVEQSIILRVERAISDLKGVESVKAIAAEGIGLMVIEVDYDYSVRQLLEDIKARVDAITQFPAEASRPIVAESNLRGGVSKIMISGPADERTLQKIALKLRQQLIDTGEISQVELTDSRATELQVIVDQFRLQRYGISMMELVHAIQSAAADLPGGSVVTQGGTVTIRTQAAVRNAEEIGDMILRAIPDGGRVLVRDVAEIHEGFSGDAQVFFNGHPAVSLSIYRTGNENIMSIAAAVEREISQPRFYLPDPIQLTVWQDAARLVESRLNLLTSNAITGLALVFVILILFMQARSAFWVSFGVPVVFMGTLAVMPFLGLSLNMISLFGFILVLGILVDDAIVVGDSINYEYSCGRYGVLGAQQGVLTVATPVIFSTLTTLVAFLPLVFMGGLQGKLARDIPIVVIVSLTISLAEALLILPSHLVSKQPTKGEIFAWLKRLQELFAFILDSFVKRYYLPALEWFLRHSGWGLAIFVAVYFVTVGLLWGGWLGTLDNISIESEYITVQLDYPVGTSLEQIRGEMEQVRLLARSIEEKLKEQTGESYFLGVQIVSGVKELEYQANMTIGLTPNENRKLDTITILEQLQLGVANLDLIGRASFQSGHFDEGGRANLQLTGFNLHTLTAAAELIKSRLATYAFVYDIADDQQRGRAEVKLSLKPAAKDLGLSEAGLALQVRQSFYGVLAHTLLVDEVETGIFVRYPHSHRESLWYLENLPILLPSGESVPLVNIAEVKHGEAPLYINRIDGKRVINLSAMTDYRGSQPARLLQTLVSELQPILEQQYPDVNMEIAGQVRSQESYKQYLLKSVVLSLLGMYILMAVSFRSYWQPLMIMVAVPFGQIGALLGHAMTGVEISLWSFVGIVAVSGVVVNDNIVLIDCINRLRKEADSLNEVLKRATQLRFRPIMLTSITTFAGLTPLLLERSWQAQFLKPMAVSLAFGVMFATLMTLFLVPALYVLFEQAMVWFRSRKELALGNLQRAEPSPEVLDQVYEQGYAHGISGGSAASPFSGEVLEAGWLAGWQDGHAIWNERHSDKK